jgi:hypothetical protein
MSAPIHDLVTRELESPFKARQNIPSNRQREQEQIPSTPRRLINPIKPIPQVLTFAPVLHVWRFRLDSFSIVVFHGAAISVTH